MQFSKLMPITNRSGLFNLEKRPRAQFGPKNVKF